MTDPLLSIIIVSYNTREMTLKCLRAVYGALGETSAEIFVVDNASQDGSAAAISAEFPQIRLITNSANAGFGAANNIAMEKARGNYLLLLNSDAFLQDHAIATLIEYLERNPRVAILGPRLVNADGTLQLSCFPFPTPLRCWVENLWLARLFSHTARLGDYRKWAHDQERLVDWVVGACMMVRRQVYLDIGGFDDQFFMYSEEADWQRRIRAAGWEIGFTPQTSVEHLGGGSGASNRVSINRHFFDSLDRYELKHHGWIGLFLLRSAMVLGSTLRAALWAMVWLGRPARRPVASSKVRLHVWLLGRQLTHWPVSARTSAPQLGGQAA